MSDEIKNGDMVYTIAKFPTESIKRFIGERVGGTKHTKYVCEDLNGGGISYHGNIYKVPENKLIEWNSLSAPVPPFCVRDKHLNALFTVVEVGPTRHGVKIASITRYIKYKELLEHYVFVDKDRNEYPCGENFNG